MKVTLEGNDKPALREYPCILDDKHDGYPVIVLAKSVTESIVLRSEHSNFTTGDEFYAHSTNAPLYRGKVILEN